MQIYLRQSSDHAQIAAEIAMLNAFMQVLRDLYSGLPALSAKVKDSPNERAALFFAANASAPLLALLNFSLASVYVTWALPLLGREGEVLKEARELPKNILPVITAFFIAMANTALGNAKKNSVISNRLAATFLSGGFVMFSSYYWILRPFISDSRAVIYANGLQSVFMAVCTVFILVSSDSELKNFSVRNNGPLIRAQLPKMIKQGWPFIITNLAQQTAGILTGMMLIDPIQRAAYQVPQVLLVAWFSVLLNVSQRLQSQVAALPRDKNFSLELKKLFSTVLAVSLFLPLAVAVFVFSRLSQAMNILLAGRDPAIAPIARQIAPLAAVNALFYCLSICVAAVTRGVQNTTTPLGARYQKISTLMNAGSSMLGFFLGFIMNEKQQTGALGFAVAVLGAQVLNLSLQSGLALRAIKQLSLDTELLPVGSDSADARSDSPAPAILEI